MIHLLFVEVIMFPMTTQRGKKRRKNLNEWKMRCLVMVGGAFFLACLLQTFLLFSLQIKHLLLHFKYIGSIKVQIYFSNPILVLYYFCNPTYKIKIGTTNKWWTFNIKPLELISMMGQ
jgi:hypothetical protein